MRPWLLVLVFVFLSASGRSAGAQITAPVGDDSASSAGSRHPPAPADTTADTTAARGRWSVGASIGVPGSGADVEPELVTIGLTATRFTPNRPGVDLAIGTAPRALAVGLVAVAARAGLALPLALSRDAYLVPSAGASVVGVGGWGGGAGVYGLNAGIAGIVRSGPVGLRAGVTWHRMFATGQPIWLLEVGAVGMPAR